MLLKIQAFRGFDKNQSYGVFSIYYRFFNEKPHHQILGYRSNGFGFILSSYSQGIVKY